MPLPAGFLLRLKPPSDLCASAARAFKATVQQVLYRYSYRIAVAGELS